jgi:hypothetical protein
MHIKTKIKSHIKTKIKSHIKTKIKSHIKTIQSHINFCSQTISHAVENQWHKATFGIDPKATTTKREGES